jgi:hypothetical protein
MSAICPVAVSLGRLRRGRLPPPTEVDWQIRSMVDPLLRRDVLSVPVGVRERDSRVSGNRQGPG